MNCELYRHELNLLQLKHDLIHCQWTAVLAWDAVIVFCLEGPESHQSVTLCIITFMNQHCENNIYQFTETKMDTVAIRKSLVV